jgi:hypothetical protein
LFTNMKLCNLWRKWCRYVIKHYHVWLVSLHDGIWWSMQMDMWTLGTLTVFNNLWHTCHRNKLLLSYRRVIINLYYMVLVLCQQGQASQFLVLWCFCPLFTHTGEHCGTCRLLCSLL